MIDMPGSGGSKYGIIDDQLPTRSSKEKVVGNLSKLRKKKILVWDRKGKKVKEISDDEFRKYDESLFRHTSFDEIERMVPQHNPLRTIFESADRLR